VSPACPLGDRGLLVGNQPAFDLGELRRRLVCLHRQRKPPASAGAPEQGLVDLGNPSGRLFPPRPAISCIAAGVMRPQSPVRRRPRSHAWRGRSRRSVWMLCNLAGHLRGATEAALRLTSSSVISLPEARSARCIAAFLTVLAITSWLPGGGTRKAATCSTRGERLGAMKDDYRMGVASERTLSQKISRCLLTLGTIAVLAGAAAHAENFDQGKSGARLFADTCVTCHRNARGLAKGRFSLTLYMFLQQHYVSNSSAAWELTSYLESVDTVPRSRSRAAAAKPSPPASETSGSSLRPPAAVPGH